MFKPAVNMPKKHLNAISGLRKATKETIVNDDHRIAMLDANKQYGYCTMGCNGTALFQMGTEQRQL